MNTQQIKTVRASALPMAMTCPQSAALPDLVMSSITKSATEGSACHHWLSLVIMEKVGLFDEETINTLVDGFDLSLHDFRKLTQKAFRLWVQCQNWFPEPIVETMYAFQDDNIYITGTPDVIYYDEERETIFVYDHKTGWDDSDHTDQLKAYGWILLNTYQDAKQVHLIVGRVRDYVTDQKTYSREALTMWWSSVKERLIDQASHYNPGKKCNYCNRVYNCEAYRNYTKGTISLLLNIESNNVFLDTSPENIIKLYMAKRALQVLIDKVDEVIKSAVEKNKGLIEFDNGYQLQAVQQPRQEIIYSMALETLADIVPPERLRECFSVSKTKLETEIKATAPRGKKQQLFSEVMEKLAEIGAINVKMIERLEYRKQDNPPQLTQGE